MFDLFKRHRTAILLVFYLGLAFVLLLADRREPRRLDAPSQLGARAQLHALDVISHGSGAFGRFWASFTELLEVREENERLRAELERLQEEHARLVGVMQENARLRALTGFQEAHPNFELLPARVISRDTTRYFRVVSLRLRADDPRVQPGQPVLSSAGLVGQVVEVNGPFANVMLTVDPRSSVDVIVQRNRARGIVQGIGYDNAYTSRVAYLLRREEVREGDLVVTSGVGGAFPPELVVGRIARVERGQQGLFQEVRVEPAVDFGRLEEVFILLTGLR